MILEQLLQDGVIQKKKDENREAIPFNIKIMRDVVILDQKVDTYDLKKKIAEMMQKDYLQSSYDLCGEFLDFTSTN